MTQNFPKLNAVLLVDLIEWAEASEKSQESGKAGLVQIDNYLHHRTGKPLKRVWDQEQWWCGTSCCIAGGAAAATGAQTRPYGYEINSLVVRKNKDDDWIHIADYARDVLGLTFYEADELFTSYNTSSDLREFVNGYAQKRGITLPWNSHE